MNTETMVVEPEMPDRDLSYLSRARSCFDELEQTFQPTTGIIVVGCGDHRRFWDITGHLRAKFVQDQLFPISYPGLPLRIDSRFAGSHRDHPHIFLNGILEAMEATGFCNVVLIPHWVCKIGLRHELIAQDAFRSSRRAAEIVSAALEPRSGKVWSLFDVAWNGEKKKTYCVNLLKPSVASHLGIL